MRYFLSKKIILVVAVTIVVVTILSVSYNNYRIRSYYKQQMANASGQIINKINDIVTEYDQVIIQSIKEAQGKTCNDIESYINRTILSTYRVRSITLVHNGSVFCSSLNGANQLNKQEIDSFFKTKLNVLDSRFLKPKTQIVASTLIQGDWSGSITIPAVVFFNELPQTMFAENTYLVFGDKWLNIKTHQLLENITQDRKWRLFDSKQFPFDVAFDYSAIKKDNAFYLSYFLIGIGMFSLFAVLAIYTILTRSRFRFQRAISNDELIPYYQLIVSAADQRWIGVEVLTRWQHPRKGLLMPCEFIPLAESSGLIIPMTKMLMKKVARELTKYVSVFPKPLHIGFNIHASHLRNHGLIDDCKTFLNAFPANTIHLTLEISESQFIESSSELDDLLQEFRKIGITIAIDDFGTGYSNFGYLQRYNIDHLKIDKLFVSKTCSKPTDTTHLLDTIISLSKKLKMNTIAEGVETKEQFYHLTRQGVESVQGFLFSKPSPLQEMITLLSKPVKRIELPRRDLVKLETVI